MKNKAGYIGDGPNLIVNAAPGVWSLADTQKVIRSGEWSIVTNRIKGIGPRAWCVTEKCAGEKLTGSVYPIGSSTYFIINWWDGTSQIYNTTTDGFEFSKTSAGGTKAFEIYTCDATGAPSLDNFSFDLSGNALVYILPENLFIDSDPGYGTWYYYIPTTASVGWNKYRYNSGSRQIADISDNNLSASALDSFYGGMVTGSYTGGIIVSGNPGVGSDTTSIATNKGYTVYGSVPEENVLLFKFNGANASTTIVDSSPLSLSYTASGGAQLSTTYSKFGPTSLYSNNGVVVNSAFNVPGLADGQWTVEFWIRLASGTGIATVLHMLAQTNAGTTGGLHMYFDDNRFTPNDGNSFSSNINFADYVDKWTHVAVSYDGEIRSVYFDGRMVERFKQGFFGSGNCYASIGQYGCWYGSYSLCGPTTDRFYMDSIRIVKGRSICSGSFVLPGQEFSATISNYSPGITELLLNFNGANASTFFSDGGHNLLSVTANGNAQISTAQSKFGGESGYFDGTGDYLTIANTNHCFDLYCDDFTIECWIRVANTTGVKTMCCKRDVGNYHGFCFFVNGTSLGFVASYTETQWDIQLSTTGGITANTWQHVAVVRKGVEVSLFIDGNKTNTVKYYGIAKGIAPNTDSLYVGVGDGTGGQAFNGYIDDLRIVRGKAIYTTDYSVPTSELTRHPS